MITNFTQRWTAEGKPIYRPLREYFNPRYFEIEKIDERTAKEFIKTYHYSKSLPAARRRFGLFEKGILAGVAVYSHPMAEKVITHNVFGCEKGSDGLELGRLRLTDSVLSNGESFFVAECHRRLKKENFVGVVSFSDDVPRASTGGEKTHVGHLGTVYQSLERRIFEPQHSGETLPVAGRHDLLGTDDFKNQRRRKRAGIRGANSRKFRRKSLSDRQRRKEKLA